MVEPAVSAENFSLTFEKSTEPPVTFLAVCELDLIDVGDSLVQTRIAFFVLVLEPEELLELRCAWSRRGKKTKGCLRQRRVVRILPGNRSRERRWQISVFRVYLDSLAALARMVKVAIGAELLAATIV
ncbi:MAG: hypothetical protein WA993_17335 [Candidatus Binatus sp.]|uniref:hypothetical protein n=1 Tax=Candidatus Binatus sp. TaxID=2811406 RepID=UPI003CB743EE